LKPTKKKIVGNLGDGSGIELRHRLKAAGNTVPVIYMTGNDSPAVRTSALQSVLREERGRPLI
jgi:DNA-binding response OmpR family regulator